MDDGADHQVWMSRALVLAAEAGARGEVPVGAVVVLAGEIIGEGSNNPIGGCDPTAHAEIIALRAAAQHSGNYRLPGAVLYVTIEPCTMCCGAIIHARVDAVVFGATEPKAGGVVSQGRLLQSDFANHLPKVTAGVMAEQCSNMVSDFFRHRREAKKALKKKLRQP